MRIGNRRATSHPPNKGRCRQRLGKLRGCLLRTQAPRARIPPCCAAFCARKTGFHFAQSFKQAFGVPPHRYLLTRRIERATACCATSSWRSRKSPSPRAGRAWARSAAPFATSPARARRGCGPGRGPRRRGSTACPTVSSAPPIGPTHHPSRSAGVLRRQAGLSRPRRRGQRRLSLAHVHAPGAAVLAARPVQAGAADVRVEDDPARRA